MTATPGQIATAVDAPDVERAQDSDTTTQTVTDSPALVLPVEENAPARHQPVSRPVVGFLGRVTLKLLARAPLPLLHSIGSLVGRLAALIPNSSRHYTRINLELCLPDESPARRRELERRSCLHLGRAVFELPLLWSADRRTMESLVRRVHGQQYLDAARASGRGMVLASPHVGSWEFLGLWFSMFHPAVGLYKRPRIRQFVELTLAGRNRFGGRMLEASRGSLREFVRALKRNECVWMMADQMPRSDAGQWSPFFGRPALTATLLPRLVSSTGAAVIWAYAERLPRGRGYDIHLLPADDDIRNPDMQRAADAVNRDTEKLIRRCPEQNLWRYRRFRRTVDGSRSPYK